ncbi:MAG: PqqD family peptide modification chaperone, partial [Alphaproteobacteria bacterium]
MGRRTSRRRYWCGGNREPGQDVFFIEALDERLWRPGSAEEWDACWYTGMPDPEVFERLDPTRSINHIPGNNALTIKSHLARTLARHRALIAGRPQAPEMAFFPATFIMPADYPALQEAAAARPGRRWLLKPANSSRGRGIRLLADAAAAPREPGWIVQEYVARPHLYEGRKYVLRLYVLITSVEPLVAWLYEEGFQKLASAPYDPDDPGNIYAHLTNPDVNETNTAAPSPVVFVGLGRYRQWLREQGIDDAALFTRIEDMLRMTVIAGRENMRRRLAEVEADTRGCYELLGIDCLIDADLKPWIMECNLSPSLEVCAAPDDGGDFEAATKRRLVEDMVALLGLNEIPDPALLSAPVPERIITTFTRQTARRGGFRLLCPGPDPAAHLAAFPAPGAGDVHLLAHLHGQLPELVFAPEEAGELYEEDRLLLYAAREGRIMALNEVASLVWLKMAEGEPIGRIADMLAARSSDPWATRRSVWALVDDWARRGLIRLAGSEPDPAIARPAPAAAG